MNKKNYVILVIGIYMIFEGIAGMRSNLVSGLPVALKIINGVLMLFCASVGFFLMKLKNWARLVALVFASIIIGLFVTYGVSQIHSQTSLFDTKSWQRIFNARLLLQFIVQILIVFYLARPKVKEQFK